MWFGSEIVKNKNFFFNLITLLDNKIILIKFLIDFFKKKF